MIQLTTHEQYALLFVTVGLLLGSGIKAFGWSNEPGKPLGFPEAQPNLVALSTEKKTVQAPKTSRSSRRGATKSFQGTINLNSADSAGLQRLPGIGPVMAERILAYRSKLKVFTSVDQLLKVVGIGKAKLAKIAPHVTL